MTERKSAVIIGAGIGGIATAIYLAKNGYNVSVFEKNSAAGGRCGQLIREGHRFDLGATMLIMPAIYKDIFNSLGIPLFEKNEINPLKNLYNIYFDNNDVLTFTTDKEKMRLQHERIESGSYAKSQKYVKDGYEIFQTGMNKLIGRNFDNIFQFANFRNIGMLVKLKTYISNWRYVKKFFRDTHLRMAYTFQNIYVGQSPFDSPAPENWEHACNISRGSVFGSLAHNLMQMGYFRPHNQHGRYKNLFFVGGSTHPGNGIPNVLLSAKLTAERILNK